MGFKRYIILFLLVTTLVWVNFSCKKNNPNISAEKPDKLPYYTLFSPNSPFNMPISPNPEIDINSDKMVERLQKEFDEQGMFVAVKGYTINVFYAGENTPVFDVTLLASWAPARKILKVPIPEYTMPDKLTDGHVVIIDTINGCEYDFWQFRKIYGKYYASWGNAISIYDNGIYPTGFSARGSGFALSAGVIWPQELQQGQINHALIFSYSTPKSGGPVWPATESDGTSDYDFDIPEGALIQLNPALNLDSLGLTKYEKVIAKAMQQYGMYCADVGGGIQLYAVNPASVNGNLYQGILPDTIYVPLSNIPVSEFRVLKLSPQNSGFQVDLVENSCATFK